MNIMAENNGLICRKCQRKYRCMQCQPYEIEWCRNSDWLFENGFYEKSSGYAVRVVTNQSQIRVLDAIDLVECIDGIVIAQTKSPLRLTKQGWSDARFTWRSGIFGTFEDLPDALRRDVEVVALRLESAIEQKKTMAECKPSISFAPSGMVDEMHDWDFSKLQVLRDAKTNVPTVDDFKSPPLSICAAHTKARTVIATPIIADPDWVFIMAYTYNRSDGDMAALEELVELAKLGMERQPGARCGMADAAPHDWDMSKLQVLHGVDPPLSICAAHTNGDPDRLFTLAYTCNKDDRAALENLVELAKLGMERRKHSER